MGMSIDDAIETLKDTNTYGTADIARRVAIDTMIKYQKITEIVAEWKVDSWTDGISYNCMVKISEVLEYGDDNIASETRNP